MLWLNPAPLGAQVTPEPFQIGRVSDAVHEYLTFPFELPEVGGPGGPPSIEPFPGSMEASFSNIVVTPGGGVIGGDLLEFDVTITNTSPIGSGIVLTAFAFQSKVSESPALASRIGDKLFYAYTVLAGPGQMDTVKKNGTSNGLFSGEWKGICINSSVDFIPEFNSGVTDESLECAGNRADLNLDGDPELLTGGDMLGLRPGESQTIRIALDSGTTDGGLHVVQQGTLTGTVEGVPIVGPNGITYYDVVMDTPGTVLDIVEFGDNKVLRNSDGTFNPTFAPLADGLSFINRQYLTLPRRNFAFSDIIGRNHTCETYGLTNGLCAPGNPDRSPFLNFLGTGDLVPGIENFAAILHGFGEFYDPNLDFVPDVNPMGEFPGDTRPNFPYGVLCENCGGLPYVPIAEFYVDVGGGVLTRQMVAGNYGALGSADQYTAFIDSFTAEDITQEIIPEPDPGGPCLGGGNKPACAQLGGSAEGIFHSLTVVPGAGINGGDAIEFTIDITNNSPADVYLTSFNYQTKERGLADIGILDGTTQDRRDIRLDPTLPPCLSLDQGACWNSTLGIGHFPNVIGNGLLFGQMVWTNADAGREPVPVDSDQVFVNPATGIDPVAFWLESVKKNGPFAPILRGNENFICVKSGLFDTDPDADTACAGQPAILIDADGEPVPGNISQRLGLPPGETQSVRIRMEFGDFRGALLQIVAGTLNPTTVDPRYAATEGLARFFDCSDQRELEYCHPFLVGSNIGYLPNTDANWLTPETLEEIEYVIINQPGSAPTVMNFQQNFGLIMTMAGFVPSAEFYAPDPNPELIGTPYEGVLIRQQVLGRYAIPNTQPVLTLSSDPLEVNEGETASRVFSASDPNLDPLTVTTTIGTITEMGDGNYLWEYLAGDGPSVMTVEIQVLDDQGSSALGSFELTINNVAPEAVFSGDASEVDVNVPVMLSFSSGSDPSADDVTAGFTYSFNCENDGTFEVENSATPEYSCTYTSADTYTAVGRIYDKDNDYTEYTFEIIVNDPSVTPTPTETPTTDPNIPPTADAGPDQTVSDVDNNGSELVTLDGSLSSDSDGTIVNYSWYLLGSLVGSGVSPQVNLPLGVHDITLVVTDDDGAEGIDMVLITVEAGTPTTTSTPPTSTPPTSTSTPPVTPTWVQIEAETFNSAAPGVQIFFTNDTGGGQMVGNLDRGRWIAFNALDLQGGIAGFRVRGSGVPTGNLSLRQGSPTGPLLCTLAWTPGSGWRTVETTCTPSLTGVQTVYLVNDSVQWVNINWFALNVIPVTMSAAGQMSAPLMVIVPTATPTPTLILPTETSTVMPIAPAMETPIPSPTATVELVRMEEVPTETPAPSGG
jgi:hypothetical protein